MPLRPDRQDDAFALPAAPEQQRDGSPLDATRAAGDAAFEAFFRDCYAEVCDFVATYVRSRDIAHELVQDLFLRVWEMQGTPTAPPLTRAYLFSAARNRALRHLRRRRVEERWEAGAVLELEPNQPSADSESNCRDLAAAAQRALDELPPRCRQVFMLSRHQHLSYQEIAEVLGISVSTVETQMWRALKSLRTKLAPYLVVVLSLLR